SLTVAMADPSNIAVVDELSFRTGRRIRIVLAGDREIAAAVRHFYFPEERAQQFAPIPLDETPHAVPLQADSFAVHPGRSASRGPASGAMAEGASIEQAPLVGRRDMPPLVSLATDTEEFLLREPVLATDLAPAEEDAIQVQGQPPPQQVPKAQALEGALKSTVQGDDFAAALARLLVRRGVITLEELLGELNRKQ
ncbi:MAG TPA: hypothetical protein VMK12_18790, partial [Anaeromyxobacteraceae bacterium]|nr:hypothetical protein [Anaeromyxobacteraceae bacterium]